MEKIRLRDIADALGLSVATVSNVLNGKDSKVSPATRIRVLEAVEGSGYLPERAEVLLGRNGLSVATVSNVLNGKDSKVSPATRIRVLEAVEGSGYLPERAEVLLGRNPSRMVGLVVNDHPEYSGHPLEDPYNARFISFLQRAAVRHGLELLVKTARTWEEAAQFASMWNMTGLVVSGFCDADYVSLRQEMKIPLAACDAFSREAGFSSVTVQDRKGGRLAGEHLKSLGHSRVTCITTNMICDDFERIQGIRDAGLQTDLFMMGGRLAGEHLKSLGHSRVTCITTNMICDDFERIQGIRDAGLQTDLFMISGDRTVMREQFRQHDFSHVTAVFCVSDRQAMELLCILHERGIRVPEDLSVIGFDGIEAGIWAVPPLTTIAQDLEAKAETAIASLFEDPASHLIDVELTVRRSTGYAKTIL